MVAPAVPGVQPVPCSVHPARRLPTCAGEAERGAADELRRTGAGEELRGRGGGELGAGLCEHGGLGA